MFFNINHQLKGVTTAILAALLFGASTPFAKLLIGEIDPFILAGILYLGSGLGLSLFLIFNYLNKQLKAHWIKKSDWIWLFGATIFGGIFGPVFLMKGLQSTAASTSSLLLNLEGVFTSFIAWFVFREHFSRRIFLGMMFIVAGGVVLSWNLDESFQVATGSIFIILACISWGIDNNLTRKISNNDATLLTVIKSFVAGTTNLIVAYFLGINFPESNFLISALFLGFWGYGVSIVCFVVALREIGTSRTGAYFSLAPFVGAIIALVLFKVELSSQLLISGFLMAIGVGLHLTENHEHLHDHEEFFHTHQHSHDEHHEHVHHENENRHDSDEESNHSHSHFHQKMSHSHPHYPDIHHRHEH